MPRPKKVKTIVIHCTAGFGSIESIKRFWKNTLGWKSVGYHRVVDVDGKIHDLAGLSTITNGVRGYNSSSIHIAYIGGVDKDNVHKAEDTRTDKQKLMIDHCISTALLWLEKNGVNIDNILVCGHRDFSTDQNKNGVIESWERIKECPSFDALHEHRHYSGINVRGKLPTNI